MHRHEHAATELKKGSHRFLRVHMHFAFARCVVRADRQERDLYRETLSNFPEALEVSAVAAMEN